ncbi:MAG: GNAT family N-acetyltransferase [Saprospiraceae bacterium]
MEISNCNTFDLGVILELYDHARALQTERNMVVWPEFEHALIENEIDENRQWKMLIDNVMVCNWAITFEDKEIWEEKDQNDSIFIHRICNNPLMRGNRYIDHIVDWAKTYARAKGKQYVRLDTLGNNTRLIELYTSAGFEFLGMFLLSDTTTLPEHYQKEPNCCLFEIDLAKQTN